MANQPVCLLCVSWHALSHNTEPQGGKATGDGTSPYTNSAVDQALDAIRSCKDNRFVADACFRDRPYTNRSAIADGRGSSTAVRGPSSGRVAGCFYFFNLEREDSNKRDQKEPASPAALPPGKGRHCYGWDAEVAPAQRPDSLLPR
jgi:hypothetical protein